MARRRPARGPSWWKSIPTVVKEVAGLLTAVAALLAALAGLGVLGGDDDPADRDDTAATTTVRPSARLPTVVRFVSSDPDFSERGFFTLRGGYIVSTGGAERADTVVWTSNGEAEEARVRVVARGNQEAPAAVLFELVREEAPTMDYETRDGVTLREGEPVRAYLGAGQKSPAEVIATRRRWSVLGYGIVPNLIITTSLGIPGEGGAPLLDAESNVVGMVFADAEEQRQAGSVAIEAIRKEFPDAF